jgi:hypothetical protein
MKLNNGEIYQAKEPLDKLATMQFPVITSLNIVKLIAKIREQYLIIEDVKNGLVKKYGKELEMPGQWRIEQDDPNWPKFVAEYDELMDQETELVFDKINLPGTLQIEPSILAPLEKFVTVQE